MLLIMRAQLSAFLLWTTVEHPTTLGPKDSESH
jgi:hypothetical protein